MFCRIILLAFSAAWMVVPALGQREHKSLTISVSAAVDVLITNADGKRVGRDLVKDQTYSEIAGADVRRLPGRQPIYEVPVGPSNKPLTIMIFGRETTKNVDLSITGPNFVFGVNDIQFEKEAVITVGIAPNGSLLRYSSTIVSATPRISLAIDPTDSKKPSYIFDIHRNPMEKGENLSVFHTGETYFGFGDNSKSLATYELKIKRINADGGGGEFNRAELKAKRANNFLVDLTKWSAVSLPCLRADDDAKGVTKAQCH
ncbi:MAG TPA: hypothetical protein VHQ01_00310 [Pyrinomonadaceae bacterium]|nr:hypothetical protein [Pyrinomonadaceae bacterium]